MSNLFNAEELRFHVTLPYPKGWLSIPSYQWESIPEADRDKFVKSLVMSRIVQGIEIDWRIVQ